MRKFLALMAVVVLVASAGVAFARVNQDAPSILNATQAPRLGVLEDDIMLPDQPFAKADTIVFGYYTTKLDGFKYAVLNEEWTFDHGAADPLEGWVSVDVTDNDQTYWRQLTQAKWLAEGGDIAWPQITGNGMVLCGATEGHADSLGWLGGRGYGNDWCQRLSSPVLTYDGTGTVDLTLKYFTEAELNYDYTHLFIESGASRVEINTPGFTGDIGIDSLGVLSPVSYLKTISNLDFGGGTTAKPFQLVIEFVSDGGLSDEDLSAAGADSYYGGIGMDDIQLDGTNLTPPSTVLYQFETDLQGWTATKCPGIGSFFGLGNMADYIITDPCSCALQNNVLEMHNAEQLHPVGQHELLYTPIVDRAADIPGGTYLAYNRIMAEWDQYADLPLTNGVLYRAGWTYYPFENPQVPGLVQWSPRVGIGTWYYAGDTPTCYFNRSIGTDWGLPTDVQKLKFIYEIMGDCDQFGVDPCSGVTNFTPIIDNISVRNVGYVAAPVALFEPGTRFQDGFGIDQVGVLSTTIPGNADITYDLRRGTSDPTKLGDSLMVKGPTVTTSAGRWEAKLWFRLKRMGPGQLAAGNPGLATFNTWRNTVTTHKGDFYTGSNPNFAWGYMDSVEIPAAQKNQFVSEFRELAPNSGQSPEPCFCWGGGTDQGEGNEILPDRVFTPGTKIEYFVTTNYISTPTAYYFYPDTAGKVYQEMEILPSFRNVAGVDKFPCVLYVDTNSGAQFYLENALNVVLNGAGSGAPIPDPTTWDRYDYNDASSNWNGPFYRMTGGTSGATIPQMLGYKLIMVSTGDASTGSLEPRDWQGFQQWLDAVVCAGNTNLQGFIADGTSIAEIMDTDYPYLLNNTLGATYTCRNYSEVGCHPDETLAQNDQNNCVRVEPTAGSPFGAGIASDVFGNWCPEVQPFNVIGITGTGVGGKVYDKIDEAGSYVTNYAQVVNDKSAAGGPRYRSVVQSMNYARLIARDLANPGLGECVYGTTAADSSARVTAVYKELENAIKWTLNIANPQTGLGLCINPCAGGESDVPDQEGAGGLVTRLYQNHPNPFNPRTAIKFSLAADGPAKLVIYDVNGRRVRTLVDKGLKAGTHEVVWDGSDDAGHTVTSGVYWSQLSVGDYSSNKKMVVLK